MGRRPYGSVLVRAALIIAVEEPAGRSDLPEPKREAAGGAALLCSPGSQGSALLCSPGSQGPALDKWEHPCAVSHPPHCLVLGQLWQAHAASNKQDRAGSFTDGSEGVAYGGVGLSFISPRATGSALQFTVCFGHSPTRG